VRLKRDVPRVLVTSGSRRESPVRNSSVPGALSESSGLRASAVASLSFSLSLSSTCERRRPPPPRYSIHLLFNDLPTYVHLAHVCTCTYTALRSRYFCHVLSTTIAESSTPPRSAKEFPWVSSRISENTRCLYNTRLIYRTWRSTRCENNFCWTKRWLDTYWSIFELQETISWRKEN